MTLHGGIPVTTPARTIADLRRAAAIRGDRGTVSLKEVRRAIRQADVLGLPIGSPPERDRTRSDLERDFLRLCRRYRLPVPEVNVRIGHRLIDFLWRERRLIVETDSYLYHRGEAAFEDDRSRDFELRRLGYRVERLSEGQLDAEPGRIGAAGWRTSWRVLRVGADGRYEEGEGGDGNGRRRRAFPDRRKLARLPGLLRSARVDRDLGRAADQRDLRACLDAGQDHRRAPPGRGGRRLGRGHVRARGHL